MIVRLKEGVSLDNCNAKVFYAIGLCAPVLAQFGARDVWLTAANEAGHTTNPDPLRQFHRLPDGTCQAFDIRTHNLTGDKQEAKRVLARLLGPTFDVLLEHEGMDNEHLHVQYDPERPGTV